MGDTVLISSDLHVLSEKNMPTEVFMEEGPKGFRVSGGSGESFVVSRITPGRPAQMNGLILGDHVIALNGHAIRELELSVVEKIIKDSFPHTLMLTKMTAEEVQSMSMDSQTLSF